MDLTKLIEQAPYLAAIVLIVYAFLQAQAKRDDAFLKAQSERDALFLSHMKETNTVVTNLVNEVQANTETLIAHDVITRQTAKVLERQRKTKVA